PPAVNSRKGADHSIFLSGPRQPFKAWTVQGFVLLLGLFLGYRFHVYQWGWGAPVPGDRLITLIGKPTDSAEVQALFAKLGQRKPEQRHHLNVATWRSGSIQNITF